MNLTSVILISVVGLVLNFFSLRINGKLNGASIFNTVIYALIIYFSLVAQARLGG